MPITYHDEFGGGCRRCGWRDEHDPKCELHECGDCGEHGDHHCVMTCDVIDCVTCATIDANVRRLEAPQYEDRHDSPKARALETRLAD